MSLCPFYGGSIRAHLPLLCLSVCLSLCAPLFPTPASANKCKDLVSKDVDVTKGLQSWSVLDFYANSTVPKDGTKNFQSYIGELLEKRIIGEPELIRFIEHLEEGELINPISEDEARVSTPLLVQRRGLQKYLDKSSLDQKELLDWSRAALEKRARVRVSREEAQEETRYQRLEFHPVKRPVHFEVRDVYSSPFTLTYPIEIQSTPVTQRQWVEIMGENPSYFVKGEDSVVLNFHGKDIKLQPDNPIESVTWWSVLEFANRLSEKHGLPPVYDLSNITWDPETRPEDGTLQPVDEHPIYENFDVREIRIYAKGKSHDLSGGDIYYQSEGYRLPTLAEQFYMLLGGEKTKSGSFFENEADLEEHAWYSGNSDGRTHSVGLLRPMVIDGKEFYDLYGNVKEWVWDQYVPDLDEYTRKNHVDQKKVHISQFLAFGGGFTTRSSGTSTVGTLYEPVFTRNTLNIRGFDLGFRLVRTIKQVNGE